MLLEIAASVRLSPDKKNSYHHQRHRKVYFVKTGGQDDSGNATNVAVFANGESREYEGTERGTEKWKKGDTALSGIFWN
jgi:hypothetical protein